MKEKKGTSLKRLIWGVVGVLFIIGVWYLASYLMRLGGNRLLPYPHDVLVALGTLLFGTEASDTYVAIGWSIARVLIGFSVSFVLASVLGTLAALYPNVKSFMAPGIVIFRALPTAAVVVILVGILYSYRGLPNYIPSILAAMVAFPIIYEAFMSGIENIDEGVKDSIEVDAGRKSIRGIVEVQWPESLPYITLSISQSLGLSLKIVIMSEIMVSGGMGAGIGVLIGFYQVWLGMDNVIALSIIAVVIIGVVDFITATLKHKEKHRKAQKDQVSMN